MSKRIALGVSLVGALALAGTALAGNGGGKAPSSISLQMLSTTTATASATSGPHWGDQVSFNISTTASQPSVMASCYQGGSLVYRQFGFFYSTPQAPSFSLQSYVWTGGAADCTAELYTVDPQRGKSTTLATTTFHVDS